MGKRIVVKICGVTDEVAVAAAVDAGADFLGAVFFARSPRHVTYERAAELFAFVPRRIGRVGLFVDPTDPELDAAMNHVRLDYFQLHGEETPERVEAIRLEYGMAVIKAISIAGPTDLERARAYVGVADRLLFDAKAPPAAERPGGNAHAFDWTILHGARWKCPWFLAGGLTPGNVGEALRRSGASAVDVSSGVESAPGVKDPARIAAFIEAARGT